MTFVRTQARETPRRREAAERTAPPPASASRAQPRGSQRYFTRGVPCRAEMDRRRSRFGLPRGNRCNSSGAFARSTPLDRPLHGARRVPGGRRDAGVDHFPARRWITGRAPLKRKPCCHRVPGPSPGPWLCLAPRSWRSLVAKVRSALANARLHLRPPRQPSCHDRYWTRAAGPRSRGGSGARPRRRARPGV